ncbi:hypothetical protein T03_2444 [Trichinella britovi]|uniref:Uncharacterized protein n=1 Tax=Trichinella britovi TaxID=45882 RepID=A0A0V1D658_TRIBR|nr:hypothetical protein T03_2444 [Trichinella britovi]
MERVNVLHTRVGKSTCYVGTGGIYDYHIQLSILQCEFYLCFNSSYSRKWKNKSFALRFINLNSWMHFVDYSLIPLLAQLYMISLLGYNTFKTVQLLFVKGHVHHFKCSETVLTVIAMDIFIESLV